MNAGPLKKVSLQAFIAVYLAFGLYTEFGLMDFLPLPKYFLADYFIYERAANDAALGKDPYLDKKIGTAFVYPPQSILFFEAFSRVGARTVKIAVFAVLNIAMLTFMVYRTIRHYNLPQSGAWFFYPLALGFAPFLELLHVGQVNLFVAFGLFLAFVYPAQLPWLAGFGLGWAAMLKVTPLVFTVYLFLARQWKALVFTAGTILLFTLLAWMRYGSAPFFNYVDAFRSILGQFPDWMESQSLFAKIDRYVDVESRASALQTGLNLYLLLILASGLISRYAGTLDLFFAVTGMAVTLTPNLLWYHHYVFLLLPFFILMCWSRLNPRVVAWCLFGFLLIQLDRWYLTTGLLIHIYTHLTILGLVIYQVKLAYRKYRENQIQPARQGLQ